MLRNLVKKARRGRGLRNNLMIIAKFAAAVARRAGALLCSLLLLVTIALFPVRARATLAAGALTAVGFAVTVTAFLNLARIYPFNPDTGEGLTFPDWTDEALQKLINLYNVAHASAPLTQQTIKSYALGATIAVANEGWNRLRDFVDWIKAEYAPADNSQGVQLGTVSGPYYNVPVYSGSISNTSIIDNGFLAYSTFQTSTSSKISSTYALSTVPGVRAFSVVQQGGVYYTYFVLPLTLSQYQNTDYYPRISAYVVVPSSSNYTNNTPIKASIVHNEETYYYCYSSVGGSYASRDIAIANNASAYISNWIAPWYDTRAEGILACLGLAGSSTFSGITADTATVTTPAAPVAGSEFTGMQVAGLGQGATVDALEDVIESGVQEREQPTVRQVEVEVQVGTEVDSETGEVTENPVVITPADVPVVAENYALPASITTVFPFSIPWDVMRVFQALNAEPQRIDVTVTLPFPDVALGNEISFQVVFPPDELEENETFQAFMTWFRRVTLIVMCVYATWGLASFIKR